MILQTRRKLSENYFRNEETSLLLTPPAKSDWIMSPQRLTSGTKTITFDCKKLFLLASIFILFRFSYKTCLQLTALSQMRFPFCQKFSSFKFVLAPTSYWSARQNVIFRCQHPIYGLNQLLGIQTKPKCSNRIGKVENAKLFLLRDVCVLLIFIANNRAEPQIAKVGPRLQIKTFSFSSFTSRSIF